MTMSTTSIRRSALAFIIGAAGTAVSGAVTQLVVVPTTDVSADDWSYPWSSSVFVPVTIVFMALHLLILAGLVGFARSGVAGGSRIARYGTGLAVGGTALLALAELASIPIKDAAMDDTSAGIVGAAFGLGSLISAVGLLLAGKATLSAGRWHGWRRFTPLVAGVWTLALVGIAATDALPGGVAIYGLTLLAMAAALYPRQTSASQASRATLAGVRE